MVDVRCTFDASGGVRAHARPRIRRAAAARGTLVRYRRIPLYSNVLTGYLAQLSGGGSVAFERYGRILLAVVVASAGGLAACSDAPSSLQPAAAVLESAGADGQIADAGMAVAVAPAVIVRDGRGQPVAGTFVQFTVIRGGGSLGTGSTRTDEQGYASAGEWRLGTSPGVNEVTATVGRLAPIRFTATALSASADVPSGDAGAFTIDVRYIGSATTRQRQAVTHAVARWRTVVVDNLPSVPVTVAAGACFTNQPALNEVVDDLLIFVELTEIDGPGKILGEAGPCLVRSESQLPVVGVLRLDVADLDQMERAGTLDDVVLHEIGHVLGIGTLWSRKRLLTGAGGDDPQFHGQHAVHAYLGMGVADATGVPVENTGSSGTRDGHWRESVFGNELMTGYISGTPNPLSALTVASLKDLGYGTSMLGASTFTLGVTFQSLISEPIDLRSRERVLSPRFEVDRAGRKHPLDVRGRLEPESGS
jgi:hypothetical protein